VKADVKGSAVAVHIDSFTPNFKEYQVLVLRSEAGARQTAGAPLRGVAKVGRSEWHPVEEQFAVPLYSEVNEFRVRSVNLFGVTGPEHLVRIRKQRK